VTSVLQGVGHPAVEDHNSALEDLVEQRHASSVQPVVRALTGDRAESGGVTHSSRHGRMAEQRTPTPARG
jgi:hypothetical protein